MRNALTKAAQRNSKIYTFEISKNKLVDITLDELKNLNKKKKRDIHDDITIVILDLNQ